MPIPLLNAHFRLVLFWGVCRHSQFRAPSLTAKKEKVERQATSSAPVDQSYLDYHVVRGLSFHC